MSGYVQQIKRSDGTNTHTRTRPREGFGIK